MVRSLPVVVLCWITACSAAHAGGVNLAWHECWPEGGTINHHFACTTDTALHTAVGSFVLDADMPDFAGIEVVLDIESSTASLPDWWQFYNSGSCRQRALSVSADFTSAPQVTCVDPFNGLAAGGIAAYLTTTTTPAYFDSRGARLKVAFALASANPLVAGTEYYGFRVTINSTKTLGTGACTGCEVPVCLWLNEIRAAGYAGSVERLMNPIANLSIGWQCGVLFTGPGGCGTYIGGPPCVTPVRDLSWGRVKSFYR